MQYEADINQRVPQEWDQETRAPFGSIDSWRERNGRSRFCRETLRLASRVAVINLKDSDMRMEVVRQWGSPTAHRRLFVVAAVF